MKTVHLHPHFVSTRNHQDVVSVLKCLKEPFDDAVFAQPGEANYLPRECSSTIHAAESLSHAASVSASPRIRTPGISLRPQPQLWERKGNDSESQLSLNSPHGNSHALPYKNGHLNIPHTQAPPIQTKTLPPRQTVASSSSFNTAFGSSTASPPHRRPKPDPRILCVWDVDDTLVASGVGGVRQNLVFSESELVSMFRQMSSNTRHLLLSQGSIDDVFEEPSGRLRCIRSFLERSGAPRSSAAATVTSTHSAPPHSGAGGGKQHESFAKSTPSRPREKKRSGLGMLFNCGGSSETKCPRSCDESGPAVHRSMSVLSPPRRKKESKKAAENEEDLRKFSCGTVVVRLATLRDCVETPQDTEFLFNPDASPTCVRSPTTAAAALDDKAEVPGRWLVLRPEVWGITLASMSAVFAPSRHTAFVNGKVFRKMDVVWSLAVSGHWDTVFFIDNNLSEVGVVRYGLQLSDMLSLRSSHRLDRFYQGEYLLLAASAKLKEMEQRYGRNVLIPPPVAETSKGIQPPLNGGKVDAPTKSSPRSSESTDLTAVNSSNTPSPSCACASGMRNCGPEEPCKCSPAPATDCSVSLKMNGKAAGRSSEGLVRAESDSFRIGSELPLPRFTDPTLMPIDEANCHHVDLVIAHFHMPSEKYRHMLNVSRMDPEGNSFGRRRSMNTMKFVGQPLFIGDRSCTDDQYEAVLTFFRVVESAMYQLIEEEMRLNGFVDISRGRRWSPNLLLVYRLLPRRPNAILHMKQYYEDVLKSIELRIVFPMLSSGGEAAANTVALHTMAQREYYKLQRLLPFIDPYVTGDLARILYDMCLTEGRIQKSVAEQVKKRIARVRARIDGELR